MEASDVSANLVLAEMDSPALVLLCSNKIDNLTEHN
jgi:hypothetical protein